MSDSENPYKMRKIIYIFFFTFVLTLELTIGKNYNKIKNVRDSHKKQVSVKLNDRFKRSLYGKNQLLWTKNKKILHDSSINTKFDESVGEENNNKKDMEKDIPFWGSRGRRDSSSVENYVENPMPSKTNLYDDLCENCFSSGNIQYMNERRDENDHPFWGSRGRRNSDEIVNSIPFENIGKTVSFWGDQGRRFNDAFPLRTRGLKQDPSSDRNQIISENIPFWANRGRREEAEPFWGSRGRREEFEPLRGSPGRRGENESSLGSHDTMEETVPFRESRDGREETEPFWGSRGRREYFEPFVGRRDRIEETEPFWGSRGRREEPEPFWGSRGKREKSEPFWGTSGRREDYEYFGGNRDRNEEKEPFWGSRGKKEKSDSLWGIRERREHTLPFWESPSRIDNTEPFWGSRGKRLENNQEIYHPNTVYNPLQDNLKQSIKDAIEAVENNIERLSRLRRRQSAFWSSRGRNSQLRFLLNDARNRYQPSNNILKSGNLPSNNKPSASSTVLDDRVYAEQPSYIVVERSSRSSGEDDPYFISRGKKKFRDLGLAQAVRDRRGVIEELVKTVQNDPYFIARGKKDSDLGNTGLISVSNATLTKAKDLICSTADLILNKNKEHIFKREIPDNERSRRTTLRKLAAQLQMDPYFVSRGKKSRVDDSTADNYQDFIRVILEKCF